MKRALRLAEACSLKCQDIDLEGDVAWVSVRSGKTKAAKRRFPVVEPSVAHILGNRKETSPDGYIFSELDTVTDSAGRITKRSSAISQRLGRYLDKHVSSDESLVAGHSWRHRARTLLEHGGVEPWVADALMGHERAGEGLSRYSKGPSAEQLLEAARNLRLPTLKA
ncbi:tyrosine-type recombinase/integrase [Pseudoroseomonas wenyumeiae]